MERLTKQWMKGKLGFKIQTRPQQRSVRSPAKMSKFLDFLADDDHEPDSNSATLEAGPLPESFTICPAFMVEAWITEFVSAKMFKILDNRKGSFGSINLVVSPFYTQDKVRLDQGRFVHTAQQRSLLCLGGRTQQSGDFEEGSRKKLKLRSGLRMMTQKKIQVMRRRRRRMERMKVTRTWSFILFYDCIGCKAMFREKGELPQHIATCNMI